MQAMGCAAVLKPVTSVATDTPRAQVLLPVPGRSSASRTPTPSAEAGLISPTAVTGGCFVVGSVAGLNAGPVGAADPREAAIAVCQVYRIAASLGVGSSYKVREAFTVCFCPKGVGALLAGDGLRSSPETSHLGRN